MKAVLSVIRIEQFYKNFVIFVGVVFSLNLTNLWMLSRTVIAFGVFCTLSGGVYLINDIHDAERDRLHPAKKNRPIPSGKLSIDHAKALAVLFISASVASAFALGNLFFVVCLLYIVQNVFYTFWLKSIVIVDVAVVSIGFVWRAIAGTVVIGVETSPWLIICSFLLAFFLALQKRETEMAAIGWRAEGHRTTLGSYSKQLIDTFRTIITASLLIAYMIYTFESKHIYMMATIPFAFIGLFRYIQLAQEAKDYDNPTFIFRDRITQINLFLWVLTSVAALYNLPNLLMKLLTQG